MTQIDLICVICVICGWFSFVPFCGFTKEAVEETQMAFALECSVALSAQQF